MSGRRACKAVTRGLLMIGVVRHALQWRARHNAEPVIDVLGARIALAFVVGQLLVRQGSKLLRPGVAKRSGHSRSLIFIAQVWRRINRHREC
jgi:hypothetical protein